MVFNQNSTSYHAPILAMQYLDDAYINYVAPTEWRPKTLDTAPVDYSFCGFLIKKLQKKFIQTVAGLKRFLKKCRERPNQGRDL